MKATKINFIFNAIILIVLLTSNGNAEENVQSGKMCRQYMEYCENSYECCSFTCFRRSKDYGYCTLTKTDDSMDLNGENSENEQIFYENNDIEADELSTAWLHKFTGGHGKKARKFYIKSTKIITGAIVESEAESDEFRGDDFEKGESPSNHEDFSEIESLFENFQTRYNRNYESDEERNLRFDIFKQNLKTIVDLNRNEKGTAVYGITKFADLSESEMEMRSGLWLPPQESFNYTELDFADIPNVELPGSFDWRQKGVVTRVKNQGKCGSCWAFSAVGNIESLNAIKTKQLLTLSEQQLLDCDTTDKACNGGNPWNAYQAIKKMGGLELEASYPYEVKKNYCRFKKSAARVKVNNGIVLPKNETKMQQWLFANGPISIAINIKPWMFYHAGVVHLDPGHCPRNNLNHAMLIVGFGVTRNPKNNQNLPFWIIKNSWASNWGERGYARVYRGDNTCGLNQFPTSAVL